MDFTRALFAGREKPQSVVSGGDAIGEYLVLMSDEMKEPTVAQLLKRDGAGYAVVGTVPLPVVDDEADLKSVAADRAAGLVYVTGSHARTRKIDGGVVGEVKRKKARERFYRFAVRQDGTAGPVQGPKSITPAVEVHPILGPFAGMASKENGVDVERLAVRSGRLFFGFRGPILRDGWVPILSRAWDDPLR